MSTDTEVKPDDAAEKPFADTAKDTPITAKQLAQACNTDPKTLRRFLRTYLRAQDLDTPGQGGRYAFTKKEARAMVVAFMEAHAPKPPKELEDDEVDEEEFDLDEGDDEETEDEVETDEDEADIEPEEDVLEIEDIDIETL